MAGKRYHILWCATVLSFLVLVPLAKLRVMPPHVSIVAALLIGVIAWSLRRKAARTYRPFLFLPVRESRMASSFRQFLNQHSPEYESLRNASITELFEHHRAKAWAHEQAQGSELLEMDDGNWRAIIDYGHQLCGWQMFLEGYRDTPPPRNPALAGACVGAGVGL